jgi:hypothetical protein
VGRLVSKRYERAIAGLVMATSAAWSLDVREHEFEDTEALHRAICGSSCLVSLNSLSLKDNAQANLSESLQRDRSLLRMTRMLPLMPDDAAAAGAQAAWPFFLGTRNSRRVKAGQRLR